MPGRNAKNEEPCVWLSKSDIEPRLMFGFTCQLAAENFDTLVARVRAFQDGVPLGGEDLPAEMWIDKPYTKDNKRKVPHLFTAGGFLTVSEAFADVLGRFHLGRTRLHPVELLHSNRKEHFPGRYFFLNIADVRRYFSPEHSARFRPMPHSTTTYVANVAPDVRDGDISVVPEALNGPDLWIDDTLITHFFCSDRLVSALRAAQLTSKIPLYRCPVLTVN